MADYDGAPLDEFSRDLAEGKHSRLTLVKVGAAALFATAFPAVARGAATQTCPPTGCPLCGDFGDSCGTSQRLCVCAQQPNGRCRCFQPVCLDTPRCGTSQTPRCPPGHACVNAACCGETFCAALCGTPIQGAPQAAQYTAWAA
jgi:hypothetical protein